MTASINGSPAAISARMERLPLGFWHAKVGGTVAAANFFDAFDALALAYAMPLLVHAWTIAPHAIGPLISIAYVGQAIGTFCFGWLAEKIGRVPLLVTALFLMGITSLGCALSDGYEMLFWARAIQGLALGGLMPVASTYLSEIIPADKRGRVYYYYAASFSVGILAASLMSAWLLPIYGWQMIFYIGALPLLFAFVTWRVCPESPRWLAARGRAEAADSVMSGIEREVSSSPLPVIFGQETLRPVQQSGWAMLFRMPYLKRLLSVVILGVTANACAYGILTWLPTLFTTVYGLPVQTALNYSLLVTVGGALCYFILSVIVDLVPRRILFTGGLVLGSVPLFVLWALKGGTAQQVQWLAPMAYLFIVVGLSGVFLHSAELFPTVLRARATGLMAACSRLSIMTSPLIVGYLLERGSVADVFLYLALCVFIGGILYGLLGTETRGQVLSDGPMVS